MAGNFFSFYFLLFTLSPLQSQSLPNGTYRLTTNWLGEGKSLTLVEQGNRTTVKLQKSSQNSTQFWKIISDGENTYKISNVKLGDSKSLDIINDGVNNKLQLADTENVSGQSWNITPLGGGYYRLTTAWLGERKSLDVINDAKKEYLQMSDSGNFSGQKWKLTLVAPALEKESSNSEKSGSQKIFYSFGFKIIVDSKLAEKKQTKEAIQLLTKLLETNSKVLKPEQLKKLQTVPIWIQYKVSNSGLWYHPNKDWLVQNGYPKEMERSIEIGNISDFLMSKDDQPFMLLHELAHAYSDIYLGSLQKKIEATYKKAKASGKYNSVSHIRGGKVKHYAMNNAQEYFAELTESYLGKNDFYPFNREELKSFDPDGYSLMEEAWK